jgi:tRNA(Ile)-lysidine synthase
VSLAQRFAEAMGDLLGPEFPEEIALAVSGGGDSMAMLALAHDWARVWGLRLWVVTVDHGLRPESAAEAEMVARECALLGHPHAVLRWHWDGQGNKMDAARRARLALIDGWRGRVRHVLLAHSRDDIAEGFLMRLAARGGRPWARCGSWVSPPPRRCRRRMSAAPVRQRRKPARPWCSSDPASACPAPNCAITPRC